MSAPVSIATSHVAETASTNSDLLERVRLATSRGEGAFAPCLLVADTQTAGRGRHGRRWHAAPGASLTFSLAWPFERRDLAGLSLAMGVAVADALEPRPARIGLKWPNDLWLVEAARGRSAVTAAGRKLAGVLVETAPLGAGRVAVIGIGVNIAAIAFDGSEPAHGNGAPHPLAAATTPSPASAALREIDATATPASALAAITPALVAAVQRFEAAGFAPFAERYAARDVLRGRAVVGDGASGVEGIAAGIDADGALRLETPAGPRRVVSGEWRLRPAAAATAAPC